MELCVVSVSEAQVKHRKRDTHTHTNKAVSQRLTCAHLQCLCVATRQRYINKSCEGASCDEADVGQNAELAIHL